MPKKESQQHVLDRVRRPRVHITYDVEIGDAIGMKEIPFVVGVLADLSGKPEDPLPKVKDRKFVEIDRDNFDQILEGMKPRIAYKVDNKLTGDDTTKIGVDLRCKSLDDFHPERVADQVTPVRKLVEARRKLSDLLRKLDGNDSLDLLLQEIVSNTDNKLDKLGEETGISTGGTEQSTEPAKE